MHLPRKLQLLQIGLPVILAVVFFAVTRLILPASATNLIPPIDFIDIAPTQTGTVTITFVNGYGTYGTDCYDFIPNGLTGAAASYNGNSYYMGNPEGQTATALRLLAGSGNYNIVVDGTGCEDYPDNILSIFTEGVNLTSSSSPLLLENGASMQLNADGTNTFGGDSAGIKVTAGNAITITSSTNGTLNAIGGLGHTLGSIGAAGIGGDGTQGQSAFGDITINGDVQVNASGMGSGIGASNDYNLVNGGIITITDDARVSAVSTYVGAGIGPGECAYGDDNGQLMISGNAYVYAKGNNASEVDSTVYAGDGIGAVYCDTFSQVSITGGTVIAVGGDYDVPDTSTNGGNGISADNINISGGFVFALGTGDSQALNSGSGFDINAPDIAITGGSVFGSNATISSNPVDSHNHLVYPLYIPTTLSPNNANTANSNVDFSTATPSVPYTLHTLTP
ncbi:hypothetical protein FWF48_04400, partial [Candidatus Saccharibacteria bacterium]|nr:hypothetical protein [Candidatus Saccharibacteria bacterium]